MTRSLANEVSNKAIYAATEAIVGTPVAPTYMWLGELAITKTQDLVDKAEATGGYFRRVTPKLGVISFAGTYAEDLTFESYPILNQYGLAGGDVATSDANTVPGYTYVQAPSHTIDDIESATLVYGINGLGWRSAGVRFNEHTVTIDTDDADGVWKWSGPLSVQTKEALPDIIDGTATAGGTNTNEIQTVTITGAPTGGTFTLTYSGQTTAAIAYDATAATVRLALEALSNIGVGDVTAAGGPLPGTAVTVTFTGTLAATDVALMTASGTGLTGGTTPAVAVTTTTPGASSLTLTDTTATWTVNEHAGKFVFNDFGSGVGDVRLIVSNTATVLTVDERFTSAPTAGDKYRIEAKLPAIAIPDYEAIPSYGTDVFIDPLTGTIGTTEVLDRIISVNYTVGTSRTSKRFLNNGMNEVSSRTGRGASMISGQIRVEFDRRDEYFNWEQLNGFQLRIRQVGDVIDATAGTTKLAQVDFVECYFSTPTEDARESNMTITLPFWAYGTVDPIEVTTKNQLATLP